MNLASALGCYCVFFPVPSAEQAHGSPRIPEIRFIDRSDDPDAIASSYFSCDGVHMTNVCLALPNAVRGLECVVYHQNEARAAFNCSASEFLTRRFCGPVVVLGLNRALVRRAVISSANLAMAVDKGFESNFTKCSEAPPDGCDNPEYFLHEVEQQEQKSQPDGTPSMERDVESKDKDSFTALTVLCNRSAALQDTALLAQMQFIVVRDLVPEIELSSFIEHGLFHKLSMALEGTAKYLRKGAPQAGLDQNLDTTRWAGNAFLFQMARVFSPDDVCCTIKSSVEATKRNLTGLEIYQLVVERMKDLGLEPDELGRLRRFSELPEIPASKTIFGKHKQTRSSRKRYEREKAREGHRRRPRSRSPDARSGLMIIEAK